MVTIFPPEIGGPAIQALHLCLALRDRGHVPVVAAFDPLRSFTEQRDGITVYRSRLRTGAGLGASLADYAGFVRRFRRILVRERPDVVHCNSTGLFAWLAVLVCRARRVPVIVKFASDLAWEVVNRKGLVVETIEEAHRAGLKARAAVAIEKATLRLATLVWSTSNYRRDTLVRLLGVDPGRIRVIPNHIRLPSASPARGGDNGVALVTGGRFVPHKRFEDCVLALSRLGRDEVVLRLYGGGDPVVEADLVRLADRLGVAGRFHRYGRVAYSELIDLLRSSDIYVSTSIEEGFPISLIEAMAVGLPVVAARKGAVPELVPDGEAGILYAPGDIDDLVAALTRLIDDPRLRARLGKFGASHATRFDLKEGVDRYCDLYRAAIRLHQFPSAPRAS